MVIYTFEGGAVDAANAANLIGKHTRCFNEDRVFTLIQKLLDYELACFKYVLGGRKLILREGWREVV